MVRDQPPLVTQQKEPLHSNTIINGSSGADPGEGHRGQMSPPTEPCQGSQKMMSWYQNSEFRLSFLYTFVR